jgi:hypothetical protein
MRVLSIFSCLLAAATAFAIPVVETEDAQLEARQSGRTTTWVDTCTGGSPGPNSYLAFNLGNCNYQMTLTRDTFLIGMTFEFEAVYADGSR